MSVNTKGGVEWMSGDEMYLIYGVETNVSHLPLPHCASWHICAANSLSIGIESCTACHNTSNGLHAKFYPPEGVNAP